MYLVTPDPAHGLVVAPRSSDDLTPETEQALTAQDFTWNNEIEAYTRPTDHDPEDAPPTRCAHWATTSFPRWRSVMSRRRPQPSVRYAVAEHEGAHQVVDQLHGYALSSHSAREAAEAAARELAAEPAAAIAAVEALDAAQGGPAAAERRVLRRFGYAWSLRQDEMLGLTRGFSHHRLEDLVSAGHLALVFSRAGQPYYTTPERFEQLSPHWVRDGEESFPAADLNRLERPRPALEALPQRERYQPCELHGIALWRCLLCGPREQFECQWGECTANRVTAYCEQCARIDPWRTFPLPPRHDRD